MSNAPIFRADSENAIPELVELSFGSGQGSSLRNVIVLADLIFGQARQHLTHQTVEYNVTYAEIALEPSCRNFTQRSRFGNFVLPNEIAASSGCVEEREAISETDASLNLSGSPNVAMSGRRGSSHKTNRELTYSQNEKRVRAKGNLKWDISEPDNARPLQGRYIGTDPLCIIESDSEINALSLHVLIPKRHFRIMSVTDNISGDEKKINPARRKVLEAISRRSFKSVGDGIIVSKGLLTRADR